MSSRGKGRLEPLRRFLVEHGWPQRVATFDQYGGVGTAVELRPQPSAEQLNRLRAEFGDAYEFSEPRAYLQ